MVAAKGGEEGPQRGEAIEDFRAGDDRPYRMAIARRFADGDEIGNDPMVAVAPELRSLSLIHISEPTSPY